LHYKTGIMDNKLTLNLDTTIVEKANEYAKSKNISLSKLVESYLKSLSKKESDSLEITPLVESLSGVISIDEEMDIKDARAEYLIEKYR
jgi:hypothetical protein